MMDDLVGKGANGAASWRRDMTGTANAQLVPA
jgi:hypothetical protein